MKQVHPDGGLPVVNQGCVWSVDENGEVDWLTNRSMEYEGSFGTKLRLRCDGFIIEASGNIGRFRRPDNLFGYGYEDCVSRWNQVLHDFGLPPFTRGEMICYAGDEFVSWTGAINTRIDLTKNYALFGRENLSWFMGWLATHQKGRLKVGVSPDGGTVHWGEGSKYIYEKFYDKLREMQHRVKCHFIPEDVLNYVEEIGVGRHELTLKTRFLSQNGFRFLGSTNMANLIELYRHRSNLVLTDKVPFDDLSEIPQPYRATAKDWRDGVDLSSSLKIRTFQRHRRYLLAYGIDISTPCNVEHLRTRIKHKEINPTALVAPEWYRRKYG
ncbi:MAG: hypothetical protein LBE33_02450 [Zoogloeaceae bacterium]|nr:hypothetical protein [Zoogloeaceae bacterium]